MSDTGYKPSAAELHYQKLGAIQFMEALDGHGTAVSVDWNRLASGIDCGAAGGDSSGQVGAVTGAQTYRALSVWQPYATLIAIGAKQYETRSWATPYRGELAIHAAKRPARPDEIGSWIGGTLARHGYGDLHRLPLGAVLCIVRLVDVVPVETVRALAETDRRIRMDEPALADHEMAAKRHYSPGRYAWQLEFVRRVVPPIPARGAQGLWWWSSVVEHE